MADELHVSSLVVHGRPERLDAISASLSELVGVEVHAAAPNGKLVVTLETEDEGQIVTRSVPSAGSTACSPRRWSSIRSSS
jgi:nitrate reductase NapD